MAWITSIEVKSGRGKIHPTTVVATCKIIRTESHRPILQIDTFGSAAREMPGKLSQTIQVGEEAARQLFDILKAEYGFR